MLSSRNREVNFKNETFEAGLEDVDYHAPKYYRSDPASE